MKPKKIISLIRPFYFPIALYIIGVVIVLYFVYNYKKNELHDKENFNLKCILKTLNYIFPSSTVDMYYSDKKNEDAIIYYKNLFKRIAIENNIENIMVFTLLYNDVNIVLSSSPERFLKELKIISLQLDKNFNNKIIIIMEHKFYLTYNITPYGQKYYIALIKNQEYLKKELKTEVIHIGLIGFLLTLLLSPIVYQILRIDTRLNRRLTKKVQQRTEKLSKVLAEQKQTTIMLERSLKENQELMEKIKEALNIKTNVLTTLNHEIRNPLNVIVGINSLFMQTDLTPQQYELCKAVEFSAEKILNVLTNLSQSSLIEKDYQIEHKSIKLPDIIKTTINSYNNILEIKKIIIEIDYDVSLPSYLESDETLLRQMFFNTLGYIISNVENNKILIQINLENVFIETNQILLKIIFYSGSIINSNEQINKINEFIRENVLIEHINLGVNLTVLKHIIKMLKGEIQIYNDREMGTIFKILLPFKIGTVTQTITQIPIVSEKPLKTSKTLTVLIAEDNELNQRVISQIITNLQHNVLLAKNGYEVIKILKQNKVDVIFMDLNMPDLNGLETAKFIKEHPEEVMYSDAKIIALTAHTTQTVEDKCREVGIRYFISKPVSVEKINEILSTFYD